MLSIVLAILQAIPALQDVWDELVSDYVALKLSEMKQEDQDAIKLAIQQQDQRGIENAIASPKSGTPSGIDGTGLRSSLPGVLPNSNQN